MMWAIQENGHIYVYWRGILIMKTWENGKTAIFDKYDVFYLPHGPRVSNAP